MKKATTGVINPQYYRPSAVRRTSDKRYPLSDDKTFIIGDKTDQNQTQDADINTIVSRYLQKGIMPQLKTSGIYADTTQFPDLQMAENAIIEAQNIFSSLPSQLRQQFHNNPKIFFEYLKENHIQLDEYLRNPQGAESTTPTETPSEKTNQKQQPGSPGVNDDATNVTTNKPSPKQTSDAKNS